jgi:tetratricopeptide (TPR) repeat protein
MVIYTFAAFTWFRYSEAKHEILSWQVQYQRESAYSKMLAAQLEENPQRKVPFLFKPLSLTTQSFLSLPIEQRTLIKELNDFAKYSLSKGDFEQALEKLNKSLEVAPSAEAFYYKGVAAYDKGDFTQAVDSWHRILSLEINSDNKKDIALYIGLAYYAGSDPNKAREYFAVYMGLKGP